MGMKVPCLCNHTYDIKISSITSGDTSVYWRQLFIISGPQILYTCTDIVSFSQFFKRESMTQNVYHLRTTDVAYLY